MTRIANGTVVDGTGRPAFPADVYVDGDRIADVVPRTADGTEPVPPVRAVGRDGLCPVRAASGDVETVDATGCLVTPGFIDAHTHSDAYLVLEPDAPSKVAQGITTEVNGQCGGSAVPRYGEARLSGDWAALLGDRLTWRSLAEYREALEAARPAVNTVQFVGHNTLRSSVVGYAGRPATADERARMRRLLEACLDAGAWGLTTGLIYQPGKYATPDEVEDLAAVASRRGGLYATHMRSEGDAILEAIDEVVALARRTGIRAEISHLKTSGPKNWHKIDDVLAKVEAGMAEGVLLGGDRYPYCAAGTDLDVLLPDWAQEGAAPAECRRLADPVLRARIAAEIDALDRDWSTVMIGGTWAEETKGLSGKTVREIIELSNNRIIEWSNSRTIEWPPQRLTPGALICEILARDGCKTGGFFFGMSEANLDRILARPWIVPGSDASLRAPWGPLAADHPHPRAYSTMPEFYRRVRALGVSREEAVARMTSVPARRFGLVGRGVVEKGAFADLAVWEEGAFRGVATYDAPHRFAEGVRLVMVNGVAPYAGGRFTGRRGGRFLERAGRA